MFIRYHFDFDPSLLNQSVRQVTFPLAPRIQNRRFQKDCFEANQKDSAWVDGDSNDPGHGTSIYNYGGRLHRRDALAARVKSASAAAIAQNKEESVPSA